MEDLIILVHLLPDLSKSLHLGLKKGDKIIPTKKEIEEIHHTIGKEDILFTIKEGILLNIIMKEIIFIIFIIMINKLTIKKDSIINEGDPVNLIEEKICPVKKKDLKKLMRVHLDRDRGMKFMGDHGQSKV